MSTTVGPDKSDDLVIAPGSIVVVRNEEWLVTQLEPDNDGDFVHVQGLTELVRDTEAIFSTGIDDITTSLAASGGEN